MNRRPRPALLLAAALALLAAAACAGRGEPDAAYLATLRSWDAPRLLHERQALRTEEASLAARLAEARNGDLPPTAREAAQRSLDSSLRSVQAKRRAVDRILASGGYARDEKRYPVQQLVLRTAPPAPAASDASPGAAASAGEAPTTPQLPAGAQSSPPVPAPRTAEQQVSPSPPPASRPEPPAPAIAPKPAPAKVQAAAQKSPAPAGAARVRGVDTARTAEGLEVRIRMEGKAARRLFTLDNPPRIVLDLSGVAEPAFRLFNRTLEAEQARSLRLGWHNAKATLRLVLDTDAAHLGKAAVEETSDGLALRVAP